MQKIKVGLVDVGENLPISLRFLADTLNGKQGTYLFDEVAPIPCDVLGDPWLHNQWYIIERVVPFLSKHPMRNDFDILVGITHLRITREKQDDGDIFNKDYFASGDTSEKVSLVTINHNVLNFNSKSKNTLQYLAFCIVGELLVQRTGNMSLYHAVPKLCLFDECVDRASFAPSIDRCEICAACKSELKQCGISDNEISDVEKILSWCKKNTGSHSLIAKTFMNPLSSLVLGVSLGWLSQSLISPSKFLYVAIASIITIGGTMLYYWKIRR
jgi:hypothetical protein